MWPKVGVLFRLSSNRALHGVVARSGIGSAVEFTEVQVVGEKFGQCTCLGCRVWGSGLGLAFVIR